MSSIRKSNQKNSNPWGKNSQSNRNSNLNLDKSNSNLKASNEKFKKAQEKLQESVKKHVKNVDSSSEEEDLDTENVIESTLKNYDDKNLLGRTENFINDAFVSGAAICLICISSIKRTESIWNCNECYRFFHLMCIQRWSKDTVTQKKQSLEDQIIVKQIKVAWNCPNCRFEYLPADIPTEYFCFCKKVKDPIYQPLIVPHSCGEICGKGLKPNCGHGCVLLCHPGPCPPCPKTVKVSCYCGAQPPTIQRCSSKEWSCGSSCNKLLECGKHKCAQSCHYGDCPACPKKSLQKCLCGANIKLRDCTTPLWQCDKVCNKPLDCGHHNCQEICHVGKCEPCLLSKPRTCPCGGTKYELPCTEDVPTCGDTCGKVLECKMHICHQRCHKDKCSPCVETIEKYCRCGLHIKEVQCKKPYICETKCKQLKDCYKHPCNRKCCDGNCPPCEKPCGRTLSCGKHTCGSICHRGPCYPCGMTEAVSCKCGGTKIIVPCGRKHKTRPPKCMKLCMIPPECHHPKRDTHRCHFGECPPCKQICKKEYTNCGHHCSEVCHSSVLVKIQTQKASMPWEEKGPIMEKKCLPCPDCKHPVPVTCLGGHETCDFPCYIARPASCGRPCNRILLCENHYCSIVCHTVEGSSDKFKAGENCEICENPCEKPRPDGCNHECPKPCHPGNCPPCKQMIRINCHCGITQPYVSCIEWITSSNIEALQSCGNQCPHNYPCGHRCRANCHSGACPNSDQCKKKIKVSCPCKRIKKEIACDVVRKGNGNIKCDDACEKKKLEEKKLKELENEQKKREEELRNQKELERYEKMFQGKKKHRERRHHDQMEQKSYIQKYWFLPVIIVVIAAGLYLVMK